MTASCRANDSPMQTRGPPPKGKDANFGRSDCRSGENRSGSNHSGSGNHRASRCMTYCDMSTIERDGISYPFAANGASARRPTIHAGG